MIEQVHLLRDELASLQNALARIRAKHLNRAEQKNKVRLFVQNYFRNYRPVFKDHLSSEETLLPIDQEMQDLLRLTQGRTLLDQYKDATKRMTRAINELEIMSVSKPVDKRMPDSQMSSRDEKILETLEKLLPAAAVSYLQGLMDLKDKDRVSWRGVAVEFRETLRETLDHLAPDDSVSAQAGFKLEEGAKKPTMKQKMTFLLTSRGRTKSSMETPKKTINVIEEMMGGLVRSVYERASVSTHVPTNREEVQKIKNYVEILLVELLELPE